MENKTFKVAAVVVTFNRLELLKECVLSLKNQTRKLDEIIVINNSSTDGTLDWLNEQDNLTVITQDNSGSSGGQYTGIRTAYEKGYDWIWLFEDELIAKNDALNILLKNLNSNFSAVASIRMNLSNNNINLAEIKVYDKSSYKPNNRYRKITLADFDYKIIKIFAATFEGMLVNRKAIKEIGFPNKDLFIWYDDIEYSQRLNKYGSIYLITESVVIKNQSLIDFNINSDYVKMIYGLRNYSYIEVLQKCEAWLKIKSIISIIIMFLQINKFYWLNVKKIKFTIVQHIKFLCAAIYNGFVGHLGKMEFRDL